MDINQIHKTRFLKCSKCGGGASTHGWEENRGTLQPVCRDEEEMAKCSCLHEPDDHKGRGLPGRCRECLCPAYDGGY